MLFFTGRLQKNVEPIEEFARAAERNRATVIEALHEMKDAAIALHGDLLRGQLGTVGSWLDDSWRASRRLGPKMTDAWADQWHETAISAGASGGKINGLGGCGSLLVFCEPDRQGVVTKALEDSGLSRIRVSLESEGASLLLNDLGAKVHG